ncbi:MAG: hypothetical protein GYB31_04205 [Bacteroidetes bacterium]|nr:hypothetical protein [Bacteroidota bacterium]
MKPTKLFLLLFITQFYLAGCRGKTGCDSIRDKPHEKELINQFLSQPSIDKSMDFDGKMNIWFTNSSTCYVFEISKIGYQYMRPWYNDSKSKHVGMHLIVPPESTAMIEIPLPYAVNVLHAYSLLDNTEVRMVEK